MLSFRTLPQLQSLLLVPDVYENLGATYVSPSAKESPILFFLCTAHRHDDARADAARLEWSDCETTSQVLNGLNAAIRRALVCRR
jgi:hypothetical protein